MTIEELKAMRTLFKAILNECDLNRIDSIRDIATVALQHAEGALTK